MATNTGERTSFVDRSSVKDNIDDRLDFLTPTDLPFLNAVGFMKEAQGATIGANTLKFPCIQTRHTWLNDDLIPGTSAVAVAYTSGGGTISITTGEGVRFDDNDIVMVNDVVYVVTNVSTDDLVVTAITSDANAAVGDVVYLLGNAHVEGEAASVITAKNTDFGSSENFTQIFMDKVDLSGTEMATDRWGVPGDPYEYQLNKVLKRLCIDFERAAIYGQRNSSYPSTNATRRYMGGLAYYVRDGSGANVTDAAGADLDEIKLLDLLQDIWDDGGDPDWIMVGGRQKRMMNGFITPWIRTGNDNHVAGVMVGQYMSDFGKPLNVILNRWMRPSDLIIGTSEYVGVGPLAGNGNNRGFFVEALPKDGDYERSQVIGEYTMEVRNATKAFGWLENLSTS